MTPDTAEGCPGPRHAGAGPHTPLWERRGRSVDRGRLPLARRSRGRGLRPGHRRRRSTAGASARSARWRRSASTRPRTSAPPATAAPSPRAMPTMADRVRDSAAVRLGARATSSARRGGRNSRLDEMQAAILGFVLPLLDGCNARRREIAARYADASRGPADRSDRRRRVRRWPPLRRPLDRARPRSRALGRRGVGIATDVHYPVPDHRQRPPVSRPRHRPAGDGAGLRARSSPCPCFPELTDDEVDRVCTRARGGVRESMSATRWDRGTRSSSPSTGTRRRSRRCSSAGRAGRDRAVDLRGGLRRGRLTRRLARWCCASCCPTSHSNRSW